MPGAKKYLFFFFSSFAVLTAVFFVPNFAAAATRTIADGGGDWNVAATWVENAVPTSADDVVATTTSGNVTITADAFCRSINLTGYTGTLTHNVGITLFIGDGTAGTGNNALVFPSSGWTYTLGNAITSAIAFVSTSPVQQAVDSGSGNVLGNVSFNGAGGSWNLVSFMNMGAGTTLTLTQGSLDTGNQIISTGSFNSSNTNTRSLTLGSTPQFILLNDGTSWNLSTTTNLTFNAGTSTIIAQGSGITFAGGSLTYGTVTLNGSGTAAITGSNTFSILNRTSTAVKTDGLSLGANQTISSALALSGNSSVNRLFITSDILGTARTITGNGVNVTSNLDFRDIIGAGSTFWAPVDSGDAGGNSGITFTTPATQTWATTSGGNWSDAGNWTSRVPLPQDDVVINASFSPTENITADMPRLGKSIDFTGATGGPSFLLTSTPNTIYGSLTLISSMTLTTGQTPIFEGRGSFTLTSAGKAFGDIMVQMIGGILTLQDNLSIHPSTTFTLNNGTFNANGKDVSVGHVSSSNANTRAITMGAGTWTLSSDTGKVWDTATATGLTLNQDTSIISITDTSSTTKTFAGGGKTFYDLTIAGSPGLIVFTGANTFNNFTINNPKVIKFPASTTTTIAGTFGCTGASGNEISLISSSNGVAATLSKSSGTVSCDYLSLQDSAATGGATWNAGSNSTNVSGNSGWNFGLSDTTPPVPSGFNPATGFTIRTATPNITFTLDEAGDCKASTTNNSYDIMADTDCIGDGSTGISCLMASLGSNGSKTIYFACRDTFGNKDTSGTTHSVSYTLTSSSSLASILTMKGLGRFFGSGVIR